MFPVIIGVIATGHGGNQEWIAAGIAFFIAAFAVGAYWTTRFDIEPDHVVYQTGWIFRKDRRIPLKQIQNVNIRQNLLERLLKVATVDVETAMGHGRDLKLSVLTLPDAERFREELLGAAHLESGSAPKPEEAVVRLTNHDLLLGALTENHLAQSIVILMTVGGSSLGLAFRFADKLSAVAAPLVFAGGLALLLVGAWLWGAGAYYLKFGGFVVHRSEHIFRISYGLLNKVQLSIRPGRIEYVHLTTTVLQRLMDRTSLHLGTAGSFGEAGVFAPVALFVERKVAYDGASEVIPGLDIEDLNWQPFDRIFYRARVARSLLNIVVLTSLAALLNVYGGLSLVWPAWGFFMLLIAIRLATLFLAKPENGFAVTEDTLVVRSGYFHQSISAMPIIRMENIAVRQPMWWRRYGASSVIAQAMKHRIPVPAMPDSEIENLLSRWRDKIDTPENLSLYELIVPRETIPDPV